MRNTKTFWVHLYLYFISNVGAFYFYVLSGQSAMGRWFLALIIVFFFFLLATHFYVYSRANALLAARMEEYCREARGELKKEQQAGVKKTEFIRNAYHEVRGQFWGVFAISRVLSEIGQTKHLGDMNKMLGDLSAGCYQMQSLLSNILDYAKYDSGISEKLHYEVTDLRKNLVELIDIARYAASEKNVRIESQISDEIPDYVTCDLVKFNQVLRNLINNAIKFSDPGSNIFVAVQKDSDWWRISIKDQGKGIPPELLPYIFDLFVTGRSGDGIGEGMGLGLYITRKLVNTLQGQIAVTSEENVGTCFIVSLPILPIELYQ
jgi:signal transduction histidine kinase